MHEERQIKTSGPNRIKKQRRCRMRQNCAKQRQKNVKKTAANGTRPSAADFDGRVMRRV